MQKAAPVPGSNFDRQGGSNFDRRKHHVVLVVEAGVLYLSGDIERHSPLLDLRISERVAYAPRKITFPDDAFVEMSDPAAMADLLRETGHQDSLIVTVQQSWRMALGALVATVVVLYLAYLYALPAASNVVAKLLPASAERRICVGTLALLNQHLFAPSKLPLARQQHIIQRFQQLTPPVADAPPYEIIFRKSHIGPNAFALPSGQIVLTDEIIDLMQSDEAILGVLAHELGHLHERHLTRRVIQSSVIAGAATLLFGDVSAVIANIPTLMLDLKYSRDIEREADDYAIALLKKNHLPLSTLSRAFEKLQQASGSEPSAYMSSHPPSAERILHIQQSQ